MKNKLLVIFIALIESYNSVVFTLFNLSFSSNNNDHYFSPADKNLEQFSIYRVYFHQIGKASKQNTQYEL